MPQQIVELIPSSIAVAPEGTFTVEVFYSGGPEGDRANTPGLNHFLHYDSEQLQVVSIASGFEFQEEPIEPTQTSEIPQGVNDGVEATDQVLATPILDIDDQFPGTDDLTATLYTIEFQASSNFNGTDLINRIVGDPPAGFDPPSTEDLSLERDQAPTVVNALSDLTVDEDSTINPLALFDVFSDVEDSDGDLSYRVTNNTNNGLVTTAIDPSTGELSLSLVANANGVAEITVVAEDTAGQTVTDNLTLTVRAINDLPVVANPIDDITVEENAVVEPIDLFNVFDDVEDNAALTYSVSDNTNNGLVTTAIDPSTGELSLTLAEDATGSSEITITAEDSEGEIVEETFTLTVEAGNQPPEFQGAPFSFTVVVADVVDGDQIGTVVATDPEGEAVTLDIINGNNDTNNDGTSAFSINENTGLITLADREDLQGNFELTVQASDPNGNTSPANVSIAVDTDENDPPSITPPLAPFTIPEISNDGDEVGTVAANDPDGDEITFAITGGNNSNAFTINQDTGLITVQDAGDLIGEESFSLEVTATDENGASSSPEEFTIDVEADQPPEFVGAPFTFTVVVADVVDGDQIGTVVATDPEGEAVTLDIINGNNDTNNDGTSAFSINENTGLITLADREDLQGNFELTVQASDPNGNTSPANVSIAVDTDENDPPSITPPLAPFTIPEISNDGDEVGTVAANDPDGDEITFAITGGNNSNAFTINQDTGLITVQDAGDLIGEESFSLEVTATDENGASSSPEEFTIDIEAEQPPEFANDPFIFDPIVLAQAANGDEVGTVVATDPEGGTVTLEITSGNDDLDGNGINAFAIDEDTGVVTIADLQDLEQNQNLFQLTVEATDPNDNTSQAAAFISVDTGGNNPPFVANPIDDLEVGENTPLDPINLFNVFEDGEDDDSDLTYTITENTNDGLVTTGFNPATGELSLQLVPDAVGVADLTVQAQDTGGETVEETFRLTVSEANIDVDDDGAVTGFTDGILASRSLVGFGNVDLVAGNVFGEGANRTEAADINDFVDNLADNLTIDIDGNGSVTGFTDGILLTRSLVGFGNVDLVAGNVFGEGATRTEADDINLLVQGLVESSIS